VSWVFHGLPVRVSSQSYPSPVRSFAGRTGAVTLSSVSFVVVVVRFAVSVFALSVFTVLLLGCSGGVGPCSDQQWTLPPHVFCLLASSLARPRRSTVNL
jgi:hypothetical protein